MTKQTSEAQSLWNKSFTSGALGRSAENKALVAVSAVRLWSNAELNGCPYYVEVFVVFGGAWALVLLSFSFESNY